MAGLKAFVTASGAEIEAADAVILPGVGAFGDAITTLTQLNLVGVLKEFAASKKPFVGVCLGMQLMMTESQEFGSYQGLGIIDGEVVPFDAPTQDNRTLKVPLVGWNRIHEPSHNAALGEAGQVPELWQGSLIDGLPNGEYMYFVHSYYVKPGDERLVTSITSYGDVDFCSSIRVGNVFGCQFHPERSGQQGLRVYQNLASQLFSKEPEVNGA